MAECVIVSANDKYVPYLSVLIVSIVRNTPDQAVEIIVLYDEITVDNRDKLAALTSSGNAAVRFVDVQDKIKGYDLFVNGTSNRSYLTKEAYFRLLAPELLPEYDRALYLDCDIVVRPGWDGIFSTKLNGYLLAGIPDIWGNWECYDTRSALYQYRTKDLGLSEPLQYFNSGVMLLNLEAMRRAFSEGELIRLAASRDWQKHDQDVLNYIGKGKVLLLDYAWNMIECPSKRAWRTVPEKEQKHYEEQKQAPYIIHYASRKPWIYEGVSFEQDFWRSAADSSYFVGLFTAFIDEQLSRGERFEQRAFESIRSGRIGVKFIMRCAVTWVKRIMHR